MKHEKHHSIFEKGQSLEAPFGILAQTIIIGQTFRVPAGTTLIRGFWTSIIWICHLAIGISNLSWPSHVKLNKSCERNASQVFEEETMYLGYLSINLVMITTTNIQSN